MPVDAILWLDFETTGPNVETCQIIETGWLVTDAELNELTPGSNYVTLPGFWEWSNVQRSVKAMHRRSGLAEIIENPDAYPELVKSLGYIEQLILSDIGSADVVALAGSGVERFDRLLIQHHMPSLDSRLTFWCYDIGSVRRIAKLAGYDLRQGYSTTRDKVHRGLDDVYDHLDEARAAVEIFASLPPQPMSD